MAITYRHDVDGLRAVAVLPVVAYHAGITRVPGGFVGVDVFFVISGFLITSLLIKEIQAGKFSILKFYERRVRRIFPALIAVLVATLLLSWIYSLPSELMDTSKSSIAAVLSVSNIFFWLKAGYFDGSALSQPLLHTWSLAVEEQFYIFWPLYLLVVFRLFRERVMVITVGVTAISFALCIVGTYTFKDASYYLVLTRGWELSIGGLVALGAFPTTQSRWRNECLAGFGLALIGVSIFSINGDMDFPGVIAVAPTLGAALIIAAGGNSQQTLVGRLLSMRPVVFIGLISYSLYLWHWPITVFQHNSSLLIAVGPDWLRKLAIIAVSILVGYLSWKFIEQPIRVGRFKPSPRQLAILAAAACAIVILVSGILWWQRGVPERYSPRQIQLAGYLNFDPKPMFRDGECFLRERVGSANVAPFCLEIDTAKNNYLILGDSHAAQLWSGLHAVASGINFAQLTSVGCLPIISSELRESVRCRQAMNNGFKMMESGYRVDKLILAGRWTFGSIVGVTKTLDWASQRGVKVLMVGPSVIYDAPLPRLLARASRNLDNVPDLPWDKTLIALDAQLAEIAKANGAEYFSLIKAVCQNEDCVTTSSQGVPLVFDREHFTEPGSYLIAQKMRAAKLL